MPSHTRICLVSRPPSGLARSCFLPSFCSRSSKIPSREGVCRRSPRPKMNRCRTDPHRNPALLLFPRVGIPVAATMQRSSKKSLSRSDSWRYCSVAADHIRRITKTFTMVEHGAPSRSSAKCPAVRFAALRASPVSISSSRDLNLERDALYAIPDRVVRVRDDRLVIAVKEELVSWPEGDHVLAQPPRLNLPKASQVLHAA